MEFPFSKFYETYGRHGRFMKPWHQKHKLTHPKALALLFGAQASSFIHLWKNWQDRLGPDRWAFLLKQIDKRMPDVDKIGKAVLAELKEVLSTWPTPDELQLLVTRALESNVEQHIEDLLLAVEKLENYQQNFGLRVSGFLEKSKDNLKATEEQLNFERARPRPRALQIRKLERDKKQFAEQITMSTEDLAQAYLTLKTIEDYTRQLNDYLLSVPLEKSQSGAGI